MVKATLYIASSVNGFITTGETDSDWVSEQDEALFSEKGDLSHPVIGTVFYPYEMDIDGGFLEIFSNGIDSPPERIEAKFNRLVIFNAGTHHHQVTEVTRGTRYAIAINLWDEKPTGKLLSE